MTNENEEGRRFHDDVTPLPCGCPTFYLYVRDNNVFCGKCGDRYSHPKDGVAAPIAPALNFSRIDWKVIEEMAEGELCDHEDEKSICYVCKMTLMARALLAAKPSAEGDGWIAVTERFAALMSAELQANAPQKGDWDKWKPTPEQALRELDHHVLKLRSHCCGDPAKATEFAADVANICMKIHERAQEEWRPLPAPPSGQGEKR